MQSRPSLLKQQWGREEFGQPSMHHVQSRVQRLLVPPLRYPGEALRRKILVGEIFKYVKEIRNLDNGYGFRFDQSDDLDVLEDLLTR